MVQWFLKDGDRGLSPDGFGDIADGSLFAEFHVCTARSEAMATKPEHTAGSSTSDIRSIPVPSEPTRASYTGIPFMVAKSPIFCRFYGWIWKRPRL